MRPRRKVKWYRVAPFLDTEGDDAIIFVRSRKCLSAPAVQCNSSQQFLPQSFVPRLWVRFVVPTYAVNGHSQSFGWDG